MFLYNLILCYKRKTWKGEMINKLVKKGKIVQNLPGSSTSSADESHSVDWKLLIFYLFTLIFQCYINIYRYESGRCCTLFPLTLAIQHYLHHFYLHGIWSLSQVGSTCFFPYLFHANLMQYEALMNKNTIIQ